MFFAKILCNLFRFHLVINIDIEIVDWKVQFVKITLPLYERAQIIHGLNGFKKRSNFSAQNANVTDQSNSSAAEQMEIDTISNENENSEIELPDHENSDIDSNYGNTETLNKTKNFSGVPSKYSAGYSLYIHCKCFDHKNYGFWPCTKSGHNVTIVSMIFEW